MSDINSISQDNRKVRTEKKVYSIGSKIPAGNLQKGSGVTGGAIQNFYNDQTVFVTGATGFLGTLLVEKLLRSCPNIRKLILLVRSSRSKTSEQRARDYFQDSIFDRMRLENPNYYKQVDFVRGQLDAEDFDLEEKDLRLLVCQTSVVFHIAATVRFDENIRNATKINVGGTKTALALAKRMPRLRSFVYVSTSYCHCDRKCIGETFYPPAFTADELSALLASATDEEMSLLNEHILGKRPNTYTLTKATAEDLVREVAGELPICVFRPSIVFPTLDEPMPLWMKGFNGILALSLGGGSGMLRVCLNEPSLITDIVPADRTINAMVAVAWYQTTNNNLQQNQVFNYVSHNDNPVVQKEMTDYMLSSLVEAREGCSQMIWKPHFIMIANKYLFFTLYYVLHLIPAIVFTLAEKLSRRKPVIMMYYRKLIFLLKTLSYFCLSSWEFENDNTRSMGEAMSAEDRNQFDTSMSNFQWAPMFFHLPRSMGIYMLREPFTKEYYEKRTKYIYGADNVLFFLIKVAGLWVALKFTANLVNFCFIH